MSKNLVQITAQYYENYSQTDVPYWKPKGGHTFSLMMDADMLLYTEGLSTMAFQKLLDAQSNNHERFTYISHEVFFGEITPLNEADFEAAFEQLANENTPAPETEPEPYYLLEEGLKITMI